VLAHFNSGVRFTGRNAGVDDPNVPLEKVVSPLSSCVVPELDGCILDGELLSTSMNASELSGYLNLKVQPPNSTIYMKIFDLIKYKGTLIEDKPWSYRRALLEQLFSEASIPNSFILSKVIRENKENFYRQVVMSGGEGVMLKHMDKPYIQGKRPTGTWYKVKKCATWDVVFTGLAPAEKEYKGKDISKWLYWESKNGKKVYGSYSKRPGFIPVTKWYHMGWPGAIYFSKVVGYVDERPSSSDGHIHYPSPQGGYYVLKKFGQCSGMTEEIRAHIASTPDSYTNHGYLRHPRYLRMRNDRSIGDLLRDGEDTNELN
jgi:hypothetical protein